jgi:stress response protein SCP2
MSNKSLQKGGNIALTGTVPGLSEIYVGLGWSPRNISGMEVDASAFVLDARQRVRGDDDLVFYNNPRTREGSVEALSDPGVAGGDDVQVFSLNLRGIPDVIHRIAFTVTIHEGQDKSQNFAMLNSAWARVVNKASGAEIVRFELPLAGTLETAMIFCEVYRHGSDWKFRAVGQGFVGGLEPLAKHYGVDVADEPDVPTSPSPSASSQTPTPPSVPPSRKPATPPEPSSAPTETAQTLSEHAIRLEKRIINLQKQDPKLVSLVKKTGVQLEKYGLEQHQAKVALCLDISGSMHALYKKGSIDTLVRRVLALGFRFDDDGEIDVFLFGKDAYHAGSVNTDNYQTFVRDMLKRYNLEGGTAYGKVMQMIREYYRIQPNFGHIPVYVMFTTDGDTSDRPQSERQIIEAAREGIFWQFMAIGTPPQERKGFFSRILGSDFQFLEHLDTMRNRFLDNANFFLVQDPAEPSDEELIQLMMAEYPDWLRAARAKGLLR